MLVITDTCHFIEKCVSYLSVRTAIPIQTFHIDHICYRCSTKEEYIQVIQDLTSLGNELLVEGMIGGRPIATIALTTPIVYKHWSIPCIEVPCPKEGREYTSGFEHIEMVISSNPSTASPYHSKEQLEEFILQYQTSEVVFDLRAIEKEINADVSLQIDKDTSVKFHVCPLSQVVELEKSHGLVVPVPPTYFET